MIRLANESTRHGLNADMGMAIGVGLRGVQYDGATSVTDAEGRWVTQLIDTHAGAVAPAVWALFERAVRLGARAPVLLEWDDVPEFSVVHREALSARRYVERALAPAPRGPSTGDARGRGHVGLSPLGVPARRSSLEVSP
jgi:uncharacterized protein (UPF0276 family)